jgi:hypothetical protein
MAMTIVLEFNDLEEKCLRYFAADPEEWARNFIEARIFAAKQEIYQAEVRRMTDDPAVTSIPANVDVVVEQANIRYANEQPEIPSMLPPGI